MVVAVVIIIIIIIIIIITIKNRWNEWNILYFFLMLPVNLFELETIAYNLFGSISMGVVIPSWNHNTPRNLALIT